MKGRFDVADEDFMTNVAVAPGDRVVVTGAAGFIGSAVVRTVLARGAQVVALVEPGGDERNLDGLDVERVVVDVRDADALTSTTKGARFIFHLAAMYRFWSPRPQDFYEVNVGGARNVLDAAKENGCERVIYTSTVGVLGLDGAARGEAADETCYADVAHLFGLYKRTKYVAEHEVLRAAAQGAPVSLVLPTFPVGPRDSRPTPTGKLVLDFLNGKIPAFVDTTLNVVHVDDLAEGHLLALERGAVGRSYIIGAENMPMGAMLAELAKVTGLPAPKWQVPRAVALGVGGLSQLVEGRLLKREPSVALESARMSTTNMMFSDQRARRELGYSPRPASEALVDSARWFAENGYVKARRLKRISIAPPA
jgi:dihydroflavonol-4-reductase